MTHEQLLSEINECLRESRMGEAYFGQVAVGNSKLVSRLRRGKSVQLNTAARVREFMAARRSNSGAAA
jgi:hypothetical protein